MNLKHLTDETLHAETHRLHQEQTLLLTKLLHHLRENERRRLFSAYRYSSLFAYVVGELKYSEDEANRRISAMRLLRDLPDIEPKISSGELSLTNMVLAQTLFSKEKKANRVMSSQQKTEVLTKLENQSVRSAQKIVAQINPEMKSRKSELTFDSIADESLREKLLKLKGQCAHSHPNLSLNELLHLLCDQQSNENKKLHAAPRANSKAEIRRQVWKRDGDKCVKCGSTHALQADHRIPKAVGGEYSSENIRLLCRSCNQRSAIEFYGVEKMERHLDKMEKT